MARPDGRRARGEIQRRRILDAVLVVIERDGAQRVTQRAVGAVAGVSPASVIYHFATLADLLAEALRMVNDAYLSEMEERAQAGEDPFLVLAEQACAYGSATRSLARAEMELYRLAARDEALRELAISWWRAAEGSLEGVVADPMVRRAVVDLAEGMAMRSLVERGGPSVEQVVQMLRRLGGAAHLTPVH